MNTEASLISLAMLKVKVNQGQDYLDYLVPFTQKAISVLPNPVEFTAASVAQIILEQQGLEIPTRAVEVVLRRLARQGLLQRENKKYNVVSTEPDRCWEADEQDATRRINSIIKAFIAYVSQSSGQYLNDEDATEALVFFLSKFSIPCLKAYLRGTTLPQIGKNDHKDIVIVSNFVTYIANNEPYKFEDFMVLVQGNMLANALLCPDLKYSTLTYDKTCFYFDCRLLIQILGLEGDENKDSAIELIKILHRLNGKIKYFSHTKAELKNAINNALDHLNDPYGYGSIIYESRRSQKQRADLILISENAEEILLNFCIIEEQTPLYIEDFQIDEDVFGGYLDQGIEYSNNRARENDINSVRSIYVLRQGRVPHSIEKSVAVFVTTNGSFSKAAFEYGKNFDQSREVSTVITDFSLGNISWLKSPLGAPSLPRKEILAFSYAAIRPSRTFLSKVMREIDDLAKQSEISTRDHQLLRSSSRIQEELMRITLGDEGCVTKDSITQTLVSIKEELVAEEKKEKDKIFDDLKRERTDKEALQEAIVWNCTKKAQRKASRDCAVLLIILVGFVVFGIYINFNMEKTLGILYSILSGLFFLTSLFFDIKLFKIYDYIFNKAKIKCEAQFFKP